jgi:Fe-S-cluster containining protein
VDLRFACTQCGACCRNTKILLTVAEAVEWLNDGGQVQVMCEASRAPADAVADAKTQHMLRRSFPASSGSLPVRVIVNLVANITGNCPNLLPDMRCGIYERRPAICRIYPAEINPTRSVDPGAKICPPEAWSESAPALMRDGLVADADMRSDIQNWRDTDLREVGVRQRLSAILGLDEAAVSDEGFLIYSPPHATLARGLVSALKSNHGAGDPLWRLVTDRRDTLDWLAASGAQAGPPQPRAPLAYQYIGLKGS